MIEYLRSEYLNSNSSLVRTLRRGERRVYKSTVKERHPFIKDELAKFVQEHPSILETYKQLKGAGGALSNDDIDKFFDEKAFASALISELTLVPPGSDHADRYHNLAMGICTFLFYPQLITPKKEVALNDGRKRLDIRYTNAAEHGFFQSKLIAAQTRALTIPVECKNYQKKMGNPELDQLAGRFSPHRGKLGLLLCRSMDNRERIIDGCRDTAREDRGFMIVLEDSDLIGMLDCVVAGNRTTIDRLLHSRFDELLV